MKTTTLIVLALTGFFLFSCKKDKKVCEFSVINLPGTYKYTSYMYYATPTSSGQELISSWRECEKDDIFKIYPGNGAENFDQGIQCDPTAYFYTTWFYLGDMKINLAGNVGTITYFDCDYISINYPENTGTGSYTATLKRQY